ncbi:MAG TPA: hypothetical protein VE442_00465 [Jatrophihabitans sp.]|nr:hypothetical protein [Jatrophihabitans sp.]
MLVVPACALCGGAWLAALYCVVGPRRRPAPAHRAAPAGRAAPPQRALLGATREEDRYRPAADADGKPIWVEAEHVFWHEIVAWPPRSTARGTPRTGTGDA